VKAPVARAQAARPDRRADLRDWIAAGGTGPEFDRRWLDIFAGLSEARSAGREPAIF
jgi:hypothetical protein